MDVTTPLIRDGAGSPASRRRAAAWRPADPQAIVLAARALRARTLAALLRRALAAASRRRPAPHTAVPTPAG